MTAARVHDLPVINAAIIEHFLKTTVRSAIHLVAIVPDGITFGRWFGDDVSAAVEWAITNNRRGRGVYWTVNRVRPEVDKKPEKTDMVSARFVHVDIDPPFERKEKLDKLLELRAPPSFIVDSGAGLQAFWRLEYEAENLPAVEDLNRRAAVMFGGDNCQNIDRLMRLPGTVNYPNAKKRGTGRLPSLSIVVEEDAGESVDPVELDVTFDALPPEEQRERAARERVKLDGVEIETPESLGINGLNKLHGMIQLPVNPDRSKATYAVVCEMVRQSFADRAIAGILLNPDLAISGHCLDQLSPRRAVERAIGRARANVQVEQKLGGGNSPGGIGDNGDVEASEDAIALAFTRMHGGNLRYDHDVGRWFKWTGVRWEQDATDLAFDFARQLARALGESKRAMCKASVASGAERFARADRTHACRHAIWDADPMLLGTPGGVIDLQTGIMAVAQPDQHISKLTSVTPEVGPPERWLAFLDQALGGDKEAARFIQQWSGYCLTGSTREQALLFAHGMAGTGKTVLLNTISHIMGDYAVAAAMETFTASKFDRHSTELAMLRGARLVTASETEEGRSWAEARIKALTGGDPITARFMRQDNFTYRPQFKLTIVGNHAPRLKNPDDAMRRRFNILGFNIKPDKPDLLLEQKLEAEHGRILAWMIEGCLDWQKNGLIRPAVVTNATAEYFAGEDLLGQWLEDRCIMDAAKWDMPARVYADWKKFAEENGEFPGTNIALGKRLKKIGIESKVSNGLRTYRGLELRPVIGGESGY